MWFDWKTVEAFLGVIAVLIASSSAVFTWLTRGSHKNTQAIAALEAKAERQNVRIDRVEAKLEALPDRDDLHQLDKQIEGMGVRFGAVEENLRALRRATETISNFLLNQGGKP
ncbi:DUF2730 domain-containing protein [Stappia stellulata]|uniref:DUF2730 family protein n=1 Tax=Stappia stellulata TaxID=71235 RepID=UPI001CD2F04F|nr:DUF2730 family protein [Stappia stellulata]MCA1242960.1 DUF2730 domain-containing protein [Stappia stellulata]